MSVNDFSARCSSCRVVHSVVLNLLREKRRIGLVRGRCLSAPRCPRRFRGCLGNRLRMRGVHFRGGTGTSLGTHCLTSLSCCGRTYALVGGSGPGGVFLRSGGATFFAIFCTGRVLEYPVLCGRRSVFPRGTFFTNVLSRDDPICGITRTLRGCTCGGTATLDAVSSSVGCAVIAQCNVSRSGIRIVCG